eukprot:2915934-Alexandrium_andersonii.AAC.1
MLAPTTRPRHLACPRDLLAWPLPVASCASEGRPVDVGPVGSRLRPLALRLLGGRVFGAHHRAREAFG